MPKFWLKWKDFLQKSYEMNATSNLDFKERLQEEMGGLYHFVQIHKMAGLYRLKSASHVSGKKRYKALSCAFCFVIWK